MGERVTGGQLKQQGFWPTLGVWVIITAILFGLFSLVLRRFGIDLLLRDYDPSFTPGLVGILRTYIPFNITAYFDDL